MHVRLSLQLIPSVRWSVKRLRKNIVCNRQKFCNEGRKIVALLHVSIYEISIVMSRIFAPYKTRFLQNAGRCTGALIYLHIKTVKCLAHKYCSDYVNLIRPKICERVLGGERRIPQQIPSFHIPLLKAHHPHFICDYLLHYFLSGIITNRQ